MAAKKKKFKKNKNKKAKTIHRKLLSKHLLQINFKLTNTLGAGEWEWLMETGKSTTASEWQNSTVLLYLQQISEKRFFVRKAVQVLLTSYRTQGP